MVRSCASWRAILLAAGLCAGGAPLAAALDLPAGVDPATGFRMENYRAPTPDALPGGKVFGIAETRAAVKAGDRVLIDVFNQNVVANPIGGGWTVTKPHQSIPGAVWLPGVGGGRLTPEQEAYYRRNLDRLSAHDLGKPLLIFCLADCWHSWNAAKRAADWGYADVAWYPLGTDGWAEEGERLVPAVPVDREDTD